MNHDMKSASSLWAHNPFQESEIDFSSVDVLDNKLYVLYENNNQPASLSIKNLLRATSEFLYATSTNNGFIESSAKAKTEHDLDVLFKKIKNAIKTAKHEAAEKFDISTGKEVLLSAITLCKKFIEYRLNLLRQLPNNKFYNFYQTHCGELQTLLSPAEPTIVCVNTVRR